MMRPIRLAPTALAHGKPYRREANALSLSKGRILSVRRRSNGPGLSASNGFTLVEVTIALGLLAMGLVTLIGLQASAVERAVRDRNKQKAIFIARSIMAAVETREEPLDTQEINGTAFEVIEKIAPKDSSDKEFEQQITQFQASFHVEQWSPPGTEDNSMKRIQLDIRWGQTIQDIFQMTYFIPSEGEEPA